MATVTHYIYSRPDPHELEPPIPDETPSDPWQTESSLAAHRRPPPPRFVPAQYPHSQGQPSVPTPEAPQNGQAIASWYKSMTSRPSTASTRVSSPPPPPPPPPRVASAAHGRDAHTWFVSRAVRSEPPPRRAPAPAPSIADILARDPPPPPGSARALVPPVWLAIGPSNKGFAMLQRRGWREGQGLGAVVHAQRASSEPPPDKPKSSRGKEKAAVFESVRMAEREEGSLTFEEVKVVISEPATEESDDDTDERTRPPSPPAHHDDPYASKVLLTPIPTVLKSDRLGIGLKAKTVGPYKESKKRVTHGAAALAAHARASEALRKQKTTLGRGKKGFEKARKREEERRKQLLAYLKR